MLENNKYTIVYLLSIFVTVIFISGLFFNSVTDNPIKLKLNLDNKIYTFVPQGWAFFTRSPTEAQITIYEKDNDNKFKLMKHRHSELVNFFGLDRKVSKMFGELQLIKMNIRPNLYYNTTWNYQNNKFSQIPREVNIVKNDMQNPILCGEYLVVYQKAIPWAWYTSTTKIVMPAKIIRLKIIKHEK